MLRYDIDLGVSKIKTKIFLAVSILGILIGGGLISLVPDGTAQAVSPNVIYNNIPTPQPGNLPSQPFEAQSASEFGGQVTFVGSAINPTVTVLMSSWGCEAGHWYSNDCVTTPGSSFSTPITLNVYNVGAGNSVGSVITSTTQTFNIPFRPSADATNCTDLNVGRWFSVTDNKCNNGLATPISFNLSTSLPSNVIVSVAFNTTHHGYSPIGEATACYTSSSGCGYDSLNVALSSPPTVGSAPLPDSAYFNTSLGSFYCDSGVSTVGVFRLDLGCWTGFQPAIKIEVTPSGKSLGSVTGGLTLKNPNQQISFNAFDFGANSSSDSGKVEYQNFDYPGGLHYTANVICATVVGDNARFLFQIPAGYPGLTGIYVVSAIHDGGSPGTKDTYGQAATADLATAINWCETGTGFANYVTTGGNAVVHK